MKSTFSFSLACTSLFVVSLMSMVFVHSATAGKHRSIYHDDGITEPYKPPEVQLNYIKTVPKEYLQYFKANPKALEKWRDAKFGVFMHWDPSCQITGGISWARKGRRPHHPSDGKVTKGIPTETYNSQYKTFNPVKFNADRWIKMVKDAGAKYFVFTAKHHNGFCMFDTPTTDYCIRSTPFKRDICKELADACHKYGIMLFWYYSQPDWTEPSYRYELYSKDYNEKYLKGYLYPQLRQLVTKYAPVAGIWFDGLGMSPKAWDAPEMVKMLRTINPDLLFNHRFGRPHMRLGEFDGPENRLGRFQTNRPWETCYCIGGSWGYGGDSDPLPKKDAIGLLIRCAGNGGNLLLNTGPLPDGTINPKHAQRYRDIGDWLKKYGQSIYATRGGPYISAPWGCCTRGKDDNSVYMHILAAGWGGKLSLPDLGAKVVKAECLTYPNKRVGVVQKNGRLYIKIDGLQLDPDSPDTLVKLTLDKRAMDIPVIKTVGPSLTIGSKVSASSSGSCAHKQTTPQALVATQPTEFFDGSYIRAVWRSGSKDKTPWVQFDFKKSGLVDQIAIQEGRYGRPGTVRKFSISLRSHGKWAKVYSGTEIGGKCGIVLDKPVRADAMKIVFEEFTKRDVTINAVDAFSSFDVDGKK